MNKITEFLQKHINFDFQNIGAKKYKTVKEWKKLGIIGAEGRSIKLPDGNWEKVSGIAEVKENKVEFNFSQITSSIFIER